MECPLAKLGLAVCALLGTPAAAAVNLEFRPGFQSVGVGAPVNVGLFAVSDDQAVQSAAAIDVVFSWDPSRLRLLGLSGAGAVPLLASSFRTPDGHGLNENPFPSPPQDGDGFYVALAAPFNAIPATPAGTLITTFRFVALSPASLTHIGILSSAGSPPAFTSVFHSSIPGTTITGQLSGADVTVVPSPAAASMLIACAVGARRRSRSS